MQDIIKKIIEIDRNAQKMTEEALALKSEAESAIEKDKSALREQYIARAKKRIEITARTEESFLEEALDDINKKYSSAAAQLKSKYDNNHSQWAEEIYKRVIGG